jgi:hypothetical protein
MGKIWDKVKEIGYVVWEKIKSAVVKVVDAITGFFHKFHNWIKKVGEKVKEVIQGTILGAKVYIKKVAANLYRKISRYYSLDGQRLEETTSTTREIDESQVPEEFRRLAQLNEELDVSDRYENTLALA